MGQEAQKMEDAHWTGKMNGILSNRMAQVLSEIGSKLSS